MISKFLKRKTVMSEEELPKKEGEPTFLRIPHRFHSVEQVLNTAKQMNLENCLLMSMGSGAGEESLVFLESGHDAPSANYLIDKIKALLITPSAFETVEDE